MNGRSVAVFASALWLAPASALAQSAESILRTAMERYEERIANVDNYTIVQTTMGVDVTTYFEKTEVNGRAMLLPASDGDGNAGWGNLFVKFDEFADRFQLAGQETVDNEVCYVLSLDDFSGVDFGYDPQQGNFQPRRGTFFFDTDDYLMRRMTLEGDFEMDGTTHQSTMIVDMLDWRTVEGMPHPFRTSMTMEGVPTPDVSQEDLEKARQAMQELEKQMEEMPEAQRGMLERMMKPQIERLQQILESGSMAFEIEVKEIKVNSGPPQEE